MADNIFTTLSKYKTDENYWTASLLYVLKYLWENEKGINQRKACARFLTRLCGVTFDANEEISFSIQKPQRGEENNSQIIVDFVIESDTKCIWVEVKDASGVSQDLDSYKTQLHEYAGSRACTLVLLRRLYIQPEEVDKVDRDVRWFRVYNWLKELGTDAEYDKGSISNYLVIQFSEFLETKGVPVMSIVKGNGLKNGLSQLSSILSMARQAGEGIIGLASPGHWESEGKYIVGFTFRRKRYYVEIFLDEPDMLGLTMDREKVWKIENKKVDERKLEEKIREGFMWEERPWIGVKRPLTKLFQASSEEEQFDEIHRLLHEMYDDLEYIKKRKSPIKD